MYPAQLALFFEVLYLKVAQLCLQSLWLS